MRGGPIWLGRHLDWNTFAFGKIEDIDFSGLTVGWQGSYYLYCRWLGGNEWKLCQTQKSYFVTLCLNWEHMCKIFDLWKENVSSCMFLKYFMIFVRTLRYARISLVICCCIPGYRWQPRLPEDQVVLTSQTLVYNLPVLSTFCFSCGIWKYM